ncbi:MAG: hypothetical protein OEZ06_24480 [Myxococcales bacterium]|nr:hypothetical protein [Myxococcales bacterium]
MRSTLLTLALCSAAVAGGCARQTIPNTHVEDTAENREIVEFMEQYRNAVEQRDVGALMRMASKDYFDDMGTPSGADDMDYEALRASLGRLRNEVIAARYQISYRGLTWIPEDRVLVDVVYTGWFKVDTPEGPQWRRRLEPHRLVVARRDERYLILSGM